MPAPLSAPDLESASDSGVSKVDNVTNVTTPVLTGTGATAGATVVLRDSDGTTVLGTTVADALGAWTIKSGKLGDGVHKLTAAELGLGGTIISASAALAVTIDTVAPAALDTPAIIAESDTGVSETDGITSDTTPTVTGSKAEPGATISLYYISRVTLPGPPRFVCTGFPSFYCYLQPTTVTTESSSLLKSKIADASGNWSITTDPLPEGLPSPSAQLLTATQTDRAGNVSIFSPQRQITVDTTAPGTPGTASVSIGSDPPRLYVDVPGAAFITLFEGNTVIGQSGDPWPFAALAPGQHQIAAQGKDLAGNTGPLAPVLVIAIGTDGDDSLAGTAGQDLLAGATGDDLYAVDGPSLAQQDIVFEAAGGGNDRIVTSVNYTLPALLEIEALSAKPGSGGLMLTGNGFDNIIEGAEGDDTLEGGAGNDTLRGGGGHNTAKYSSWFIDQSISTGADGSTTVTGAEHHDIDTLFDIQTMTFANTTLAAAADGPWWYSIRANYSSNAEGSGIGYQTIFAVNRYGDTALPSTLAWATCTCAIPDSTQPADGADFVGGTMPLGILDFAAGQTSQTITIQTAGDSQVEPEEAYRIKLLAAPGGAPLPDASVVQTIQNDDAFVSITGGGSLSEGTGGTTTYSFSVTRIGGIGSTESVQWSVTGLAGTGTLPADAADFTGAALPAGYVVFGQYDAQETITVTVASDSTGEANERFRVTLSNPSAGLTISTATVDALILNDDTSFGVTATTPLQAEGHTATRTYSFVVQRKGTTTGANDVAWSTTGTGPAPATASDFAGATLPAGVLSFTAGQTSQTVTIAVIGDTTVEPDEQFQLTLSAPTNGATLHAPSATATILNDDATLSITPLSASKPEGTGTPTPFTFTVTRTGNTSITHTAKWSVAGTAGTGTQPADARDFTGGILPSGTVSFAPGETAKLLTINIAADQTGELNERFAVTLAAPSPGTTIATATAGAVILNDDTSLAIAPATLTHTEGNAGSTAFTYTVSRSGTLSGTTKVDWAFTPGGVGGTNPVNAADFTSATLPPGGTLTFAPGQTSQKITLAITGDTAPELNESFTITLSNPTAGVTLTTITATGIILDDDTIRGTTGNDALVGTAGSDLFVIGQGLDSLTGGLGLDAFRFLPTALGPAATNAFTFEDFSRVAGEKLDLSRIDAIPGGLDTPFTFIGTAAFNGTPGQLRWEDQGTIRLIQGNTNNDLVADLTIIVKAPGPVDAGWFVL